MESVQSPATATTPHLGLRERKKIKTRQAIRTATYRLIAAQGYEGTTVEQIAEAAEVSPSTVFRYFPTKEDIVLTEEYDPLLEDALTNRPADESLVESLRQVMHHVLRDQYENHADEVRVRSRLLNEVPALRARMLESFSLTTAMLCRVIAARTGRDAGELEVRAVAMGLIGAMSQTTLYWAEHHHEDNLSDLVDRALSPFANGFAL
ncbi:TetR family transcriptional regulator [Streptomyces sp. NPDC049954]|uniref:TetR/AcrR family transcriptional regulator n=1 Tax=Streptomyces sp. NPDC049954 TaxID=3155779 RepID=UPI003441BF94